MPGDVRCQVRGCANDIVGTILKRYRVCDQHLKESTVEVDGQPQRFCRQCRKFHLLNRFEGSNRNCSEKLHKHNQRRRVKRQQRKVIQEEASFGPFSALDESGSDEDKSISASVRVEFRRLRRLQENYNPLSSSSLDNTANTAVHLDNNLLAADNYWNRPMDGQSETNSPNSPVSGCNFVQIQRSPTNFNSTASTSCEAEAPIADEAEEFSCFRALQQGPSGWKSTLLQHENIHICAGAGCYVCSTTDARENHAQAQPGWSGMGIDTGANIDSALC